MSTQTRHFILTSDGIREFTPEQAATVAAGVDTVPELACRRVRYLQLTVNDDSDNEFQVAASGACIEFDDRGRLRGAGAPSGPDDQISSFEYDACVRWALRNEGAVGSVTYH